MREEEDMGEELEIIQNKAGRDSPTGKIVTNDPHVDSGRDSHSGSEL
jgi:hypothetical protein